METLSCIKIRNRTRKYFSMQLLRSKTQTTLKQNIFDNKKKICTNYKKLVIIVQRLYSFDSNNAIQQVTVMEI